MNFLLLFSLVFTGFLVQISSVPSALAWLHYLSVFYYAFEAMITSEAGGLSFTLEAAGYAKVEDVLGSVVSGAGRAVVGGGAGGLHAALPPPPASPLLTPPPLPPTPPLRSSWAPWALTPAPPPVTLLCSWACTSAWRCSRSPSSSCASTRSPPASGSARGGRPRPPTRPRHERPPPLRSPTLHTHATPNPRPPHPFPAAAAHCRPIFRAPLSAPPTHPPTQHPYPPSRAT